MKRLGSILLLVLLASSAESQQPQKLNVSIPLIAKASHHHPTSITAESLVISDGKAHVSTASLVNGIDLPLELGILIDTSGSQQKEPLEDILNAMNEFAVESIRGAEDKVFFLPFEAKPDATKWIKKEELGTTKITVGIRGGTALYDALAMASNQLMGPRDWRKPTRRILILISDGDDNVSHITHGDAESAAIRAGAVIFVIDTDHSGFHTGGIIMENWAKATGGQLFAPSGKKDIAKAFASIKEQLDSMYYLTYEPINPSKNSFREVEVKAAVQNEKLELSYARQYFWN